jgi:hypothetical protein
MRAGVAAATVVLAVGAFVGGARATERQPLTVRATPCAAALVEVAELERLLQVEVPSAASRQLAIDCGGGPDGLVVAFESARGREQLLVDLDRLPPELRARTLALATAEALRAPAPAPVEAPPPAPSVPPLPVVAETPSVTAQSGRALRLSRDLSLGLGATTVALLGAGIPLAVVGYSPNHPPNSDAIGSFGAAFVAVGAVTLTGSIVSLVFWRREHRRAHAP